MTGKDSQEWIGSAFVGLGLAGMAFFGALAAAIGVLGPVAIPIWAIAAAMVFVLARSPVARAFAERLAPQVGQETHAELDELYHRLAELEERLDFAERLLAQQAEPVHLPAPDRNQ